MELLAAAVVVAVVLAGASHIDDLDGNDHAVEREGGIYHPGSEVLIETYFISLVSLLFLYISLVYLSFITLYYIFLFEKGLFTQRPGCIDVFFYDKTFGRLLKGNIVMSVMFSVYQAFAILHNTQYTICV